MMKASSGDKVIRRAVLAGAVALTLGGLAERAQAFPAMPQMPPSEGLQTIQYDGDGYDPELSPYGENDHPDHPGSAGLYDCGPGGKNTRLSRKACGGNDRFQHLSERY